LTKKGLPQGRLQFSSPVSAIFSEQIKEFEKTLTTLFKPYGIQVVFDKTQISPLPSVRVQVIMAELNRNLSRKIGVSWDNTYQAQILPGKDFSDDVFVSLKALEGQGKGQILASPTLLTRSGKTAEFLAGGEIPIPVINQEYRHVVWKKYGILLKIEPQASYDGKISLKLTTEVSSLDESPPGTDLPAIKTNRLNSHFELKKKQTIALSGLIKQDWGQKNDGLPFLKNIPVLGRLFQSQSFRKNQSEMVVFVTPEVIKDFSQEPDDLTLPKGWSQ